MARRLPMGQKELLRSKGLEMVKQGKLTLKAAVKTLEVIYRQGIRPYAVYCKEGDEGLIHGNYGKPSNNRTPEAVRKAVGEAYRKRYNDFGPTFAAEKLAEEEDINIRVSVLCRLLIESGDWQGTRHESEYRSRREYFGELVNRYSLMAAITSGLKSAGYRAV